VPEAVVELAPLGVREHLVGFDDLAKPVLRVGRVRDVRMQLAREPAEPSLDLVRARVAADTEELVVILVGAQLSS
jgi:hypothetical protein